MAEIGHNVAQNTVLFDHTVAGTPPDEWTNHNSGAKIVGTNLEGNSDYLLFFSALVGGDNVDVDTYEFHILDVGAGSPEGMTASHHRIEPQSALTTDGHQYVYMVRTTTPAVPTDYRLRLRVNSGTNVARFIDYYSLALKLDDLQSDDFAYAEDTTSHTTLSNAGWTNGASVTIGDGSSDYLVIGTVHTTDPTAFATYFHYTIDVGGTDNGRIDFLHEDINEEYCSGQVIYVPAPAAGTVITNQFQTSSATAGIIDVDNNRLFALRLAAFEDHGGLHDTSATSVTAVDTDTVVGTLGFTTDTTATRDWCFIASCTYDTVANGAAKAWNRRLIDNSLGSIAGNTADYIVQHGNLEMQSGPLVGELTSVANSTTFDVDYIVQENNQVVVNPTVPNVDIIAFTWELGGDVSITVPTGPWR